MPLFYALHGGRQRKIKVSIRGENDMNRLTLIRIHKNGEKQVMGSASRTPPGMAGQEFFSGDFFVLALVFDVPSLHL